MGPLFSSNLNFMPSKSDITKISENKIAASKLRADREIVLEAKNGGSAIQSADPCLQTDHEIVGAAS